MNLKTTIIYSLLCELVGKFIILLRGGRGSGKTYTTIQKKLIDFRNEKDGNYLFAVNDSNKVTDHFEQTITDINSDLKLGLIIKHSPLTVHNQYGRKIFCRGFSKGEDVKNISRLKFALLDEIQKFDKATVDVIVDSVRETSDAQIVMLYNPISPDLFVKEWEDDPDFYKFGAVIHTTCEDNPFLPESTKERYRAKKGIDREINYLGNYGTDLSELVFGDKLERVQKIPGHAVFIGYGLDFSHKHWDINSDPHALDALFYADYNMYIAQVFYGHCPIIKNVGNMVEVTDKEDSLLSILAHKAPHTNENGQKIVVADPSNQEAINQLNLHGAAYGIVVYPAKKPAGSIMAGINKLKTYNKICILNDSQDVIREFFNYKNKKNKKTGKIMSDAIEDYQEDHSIDAARYGDQLAVW